MLLLWGKFQIFNFFLPKLRLFGVKIRRMENEIKEIGDKMRFVILVVWMRFVVNFFFLNNS